MEEGKHMDGRQSGQSAATKGLCHVLYCFQSRDYVSYLLASLYREEDIFFIHCDGRAPRELKQYIAAVAAGHDNIIAMETQDYGWAGFSHVDISLRAMAAALDLDASWTHLLCLSEQHLPLKSPSEIQKRLPVDKSAVELAVAARMLPEAQADIRSRLGAVYRELPNVGCFAIGLAERPPNFYEGVYHGSNWFALCRRHCRLLIDLDRAGRLDPYRSIVHAEEVAIQTILAQVADEIDPHDVTLVAAPHLVDNHGLVMTEQLFLSSIAGSHLFIRKRTRTLAPTVDAFIRAQHFRGDLLTPARFVEKPGTLEQPGTESRVPDHGALVEAIVAGVKSGAADASEIAVLDPSAFEFACRIHVVIRSRAMPAGRSIRVLSQDGRHFKVSLVGEATHQLNFPAPFIADGRLHASIRVKINGLFGYEDIVLLDLPGAGFITIEDSKNVGEIVSAVKRLLADNGGEIKMQHTGTAKVAPRPTGSNIRAERINRLLQLSGGRRYLEIGVTFGETFFDVDAASKTAVDPNFRFDVRERGRSNEDFFVGTSDEFFNSYSGAPFDMIYLDGLHTYEQNTRDFLNSFCLSHDRTIWLIDDTLPNDADAALPNQGECYARRAAVGNPDASWMGDVFKTILLIGRMMPMLRYRTFEGHGQTVLWKAQRAQEINPALPPLETIAAFSFEALVADRSLLRFDGDDRIYDTIRQDLRS